MSANKRQTLILSTNDSVHVGASWTTESDVFLKVCEVLVRAFSMIIQLLQLQALRRLLSNTRLSHCGFLYVVYLVIYDVSIRYLHRPW